MSARSLFTATPKYKFDGALGTNGKVLMSDGAGSTSWEDPAETIDEGGVVQLTSLTTGVTLNVKSGYIVLAADAIPATEWRSFVFTNDKITNVGDLVSISITLNTDAVDGTKGRLLAYVTKVEVGAVYITIDNLSTTVASGATAKWITFHVTNVGGL